LNNIIIADASPLIAFARIEKISLLVGLGTIIVPFTVWEECTWEKSRPGALEIIKAKEIKSQNNRYCWHSITCQRGWIN